MKKTFLSFQLVLLMMVLLMTSCSDTPDYVNMIPDNAVCVVKIDVKQISEKLNENGDVLSGKLEQLLAGDAATPEQREKLKAILDDPAEVGIDFRQPLLVSVSLKNGEPEPMMLAVVHDADKLTELLKVMQIDEKEIKSLNGITYACHDGNVVAYSDDVLCVKSMNGDDEATVAAEMAKLLGGETKYGFGESEYGKKLFATEGLIQCLVTGEAYSMLQERLNVKPVYPKGLDMKDIAAVSNLMADKGKATLQVDYVVKSDKWEEQMAKTKEVMKTIDDKFIDYVPCKGLMMMGNINGAKLAELVKENGIDNVPEKAQIMEVLKYLSIFNGNVAFGVDGISNSMLPKISFYSETSDASLAELAKSTLGKSAEVGYKDGVTYLVMTEGSKPFEKVEGGPDKAVLKNKYFYGYVDFQLIGMLMAISGKADASQLQAATQFIKSFELSLYDNLRYELVLNMQDQSKNPLAAIAEILTK